MGLPLEGVRVLDLGVVLAGPQAALMLGDLGAEVIRVESTQHFPPQTRGVFAHPTKESIMASIPSAGGYPMREAGERPWNRFPWFNTTARNKKSMTVDLKKPRGRELFLRLAALGLPDVQCHFVGLDPALAAAVVEDTARYLFDEGDVIEDGDTVPAADGGKWPCLREEALVDPPRDVIDVTPPAPYARR